jgi:ubiquinone/menaquinone biosynthesis C-methylase UbiE
MPNLAPAERPTKQYKRRFFEEIMATAPGSVLEVGCGHGVFLKDAAKRGCRVAGIEVNRNLVTELREAGIEAQLGRAEKLPFEDGTFDVVVFQYVLHHCENLAQALAEAVRVTRSGVLVLEAWCDPSIASQRVALSFDLWSKMIDRRTGIVNNEFPSAADLLACLPNPDGFLIEYSYHLILQPVQLETVRALGTAQLAKVGHDPNLRDQLEAILDEARRVGFSDDGALSMAIRKRPSVGSPAIENLTQSRKDAKVFTKG